jgi:hypothetical protein
MLHHLPFLIEGARSRMIDERVCFDFKNICICGLRASTAATERSAAVEGSATGV